MKQRFYLIWKPLLGLLFLVSMGNVQAQKWVSMLQDTGANYYDIVKEFDAYWKDRPYERGHGYNAFRRWQWFVEPRVYPSGNMKFAARNYALEVYQQELAAASHQMPGTSNMPSSAVQSTLSNWSALGPIGNSQGSGSGGEAGRIQCIITKPNDPNAIYIGAAAGGLWMSKDGGLTYTTTTDQIASCGVSDIAMSMQNNNVIYISTGDKDAGDTHSTGVLKSIDGGLTWNLTGLVWQASQQRRIYRLLINPLNPNTLIAATSVGVYRSLDAGNNWNQVLNGNYVDAEYKPGDTTTVYVVSGGGFYRSTNGGSSFSPISISGSMSTNRLSMAVTPANSNVIYILASSNNNGFGGLYRSTNGGNSFSLMSSTPNIFDWSTNGSGSGGQGWYDIAIDASPTNSNEIVAGGVNSWKSANGGTSWTLFTHWYGGGGRPLVHADLHCVKYYNGSTIFLGTDGGIARSTNNGSSWSSINGNMNIGQIYKLGLAANTPSKIVTGHQDNGSNLMNGSTWNFVLGGDGMDCFIDWSNNTTIVASSQYGNFARSFNNGGSWVNITNGLSGTGAWVSPIVQDPQSPNVYYCGYQQVFKSINQGVSWQQLGSIGTTLDEIKVSPSNTNIIFCSSAGAVWRSNSAGSAWSSITSGMPTGAAQITDFAFDNLNPNNVYVTFSGYSAGNKVFATHNGGATWTNYSTGLPNIPINCIVYSNTSPQAMYVGTDIGVYYREASMSSWIPYFNGLPNVPVFDMEIYYPGNKLRAATFGRGVWETDLYSDPLSPPVAGFQTAFSPGCINTALQFNDVSSNNPNAWNWTFAGGSPSVSSLQNPLVTYTAAGIYTVQLSSSNGNGPSQVYISTVNVVGNPTATPINASVCIGQSGMIGINTNAMLATWSSGQQGLSVQVSGTVNTVYTYTAYLGACSITGNAILYVDPPPPIPVVQIMPGYLATTVSASSYQWYLNGSAVPGATLPMYTPLQQGYYSVWVGNGGCFNSSAPVEILFTELKDWAELASGLQIGPNPFLQEINLNFVRNYSRPLNLEIFNSLGQLVYGKQLNMQSNKSIRLDLPELPAGFYQVRISDKNWTATYKLLRE
ncbi:MAG TPA: T9SS type A sorting domain-containing protein [Bacteroidia bacterium]|nr:T9SS type A sorting domain-containing protein [Bacteroidia bacterium]